MKMSKELKALEEAKELTHRLITSGSWDKIEEQLNIVETALKEYEKVMQTKFVVVDAKISDEVLEKLKNQRIIIGNLEPCEIKPLFDEETKKKLKALEVIKEYFDLTSEYGKVSLEPRKIIPVNKLTELKEVLK